MPESEEFIKLKRAIQRIARVRKSDIVANLPKMFRERKPAKKTAGRKRAAKGS
jgi:hypothetical protein